MARNWTLISNEQNISCGKPSNNVQWQMSEVNHGKRSMLYLLHWTLDSEKWSTLSESGSVVSRTRRGLDGEITEEYEATSGRGSFVQSLICTDGFMENKHTYIFIPNYQIECFNRSNFLPFCMSLISQ